MIFSNMSLPSKPSKEGKENILPDDVVVSIREY